MRFIDGLRAKLASWTEFRPGDTPSVAPTGRYRLWWDYTNSLLKASISGGSYVEVPTLSASGNLLTGGNLPNAALAAPKLRVYQQAILFSQFTDGGAAAGTLELSVSIPAGARYVATLITGITGFTGDTSAVITVGDGTDVDRYNTGTPSVFTTAAAGVDMGVPSGTAFHSAAKTPTVTVTSNADWGAVVAGAATLTLFWYQSS